MRAFGRAGGRVVTVVSQNNEPNDVDAAVAVSCCSLVRCIVSHNTGGGSLNRQTEIRTQAYKCIYVH